MQQSPSENRLSIIAEDEAHTPSNRRPSLLPSLPSSRSIPTSHRPSHRRWTDNPPRPSYEASPPEYDVWDANTTPSRRRRFVTGVRANRQVARRGGWKRLLIFLFVVLLVVIGLAVGLGVGLGRRNSASGNSLSGSASNSNSSPTFPQGSYAINVYLTTVATNCTSNPLAFSCYPYTTYGSDPTDSMGTLNWIIASTSSSNDNSSNQNYTLSTSQNPFAPLFSNIPLILTAEGTPDEHYAFTVEQQKMVVVSSLAADGENGVCYYNNTAFSGQLYTQKPLQNVTADKNSSMAQMQSGDWMPWPYALNLTQSVAGGDRVPDCYEKTDSTQNGPPITTATQPQPTTAECLCEWMNYDLH